MQKTVKKGQFLSLSSIVLLFDPSSSIVLHFDLGCPPQWRTGPPSTKAQTVMYAGVTLYNQKTSKQIVSGYL